MDYGMIAEGDRVLVGVSGGMDSMSLLDLLNTPMIIVPPFSIVAVNIDPGFDPSYAGYDTLEGYLQGGRLRLRHGKDGHRHALPQRLQPKESLLPLLASPAEADLRDRRREGVQQDRLRPSPGRHHRDAADQPLLRPGDQHDGPEPDDLRGEDAHHPPPGLHPGGAGEEVRRRNGDSPSLKTAARRAGRREGATSRSSSASWRRTTAGSGRTSGRRWGM